jgi:hypothetical protein
MEKINRKKKFTPKNVQKIFCEIFFSIFFGYRVGVPQPIWGMPAKIWGLGPLV